MKQRALYLPYIRCFVCCVEMRFETIAMGVADNLATREVMESIGTHPELHPRRTVRADGSKTIFLPRAGYVCSHLSEAQRFLSKVKTATGYHGSLQLLLKTSQSLFGTRALTKRKAADAKDALTTGILAKACKIGGMSQESFEVVASISDIWKRIYHPCPALSDIESLKEEVILALCKAEKVLPPTEFVWSGKGLPLQWSHP